MKHFKSIVCLILLVILFGVIEYCFFGNSMPEDTEPVEIERVIDGDTVDVKKNNGEIVRVRMIGVNTPESVSRDPQENCTEGEIAADYTKTQLSEGQTIYLEYDVERTDPHGRTLAYIWLVDQCDRKDYQDFCKYNYGAKLLQETYCEAVYYKPNGKYREWYERLDGISK